MAVQGESESQKVEIEVSTVLLGFLLVMISILITMPSDVIDALKHMGLRFETIPRITWIPIANALSLVCILCTVFVFVSLVFYLLHMGAKKIWFLLLGRTFLILGLYVTALLLLIFNGIFMMRLIGTELAAYLNPIFGLVLILGAVAAIVCIAVLWYKALMRAR